MAPGAEENWTLLVQHSVDDVQRHVDNFDEIAADIRHWTDSEPPSADSPPGRLPQPAGFAGRPPHEWRGKLGSHSAPRAAPGPPSLWHCWKVA